MSLELQEAEKKAGLQRWCKTHFGEAFCAWVHLKVIRAFVESVLRYGLSPMKRGAASANKQKTCLRLVQRSRPDEHTATGDCQALASGVGVPVCAVTSLAL